MEALLRQKVCHDDNDNPSTDHLPLDSKQAEDVRWALARLAEALKAALPLLRDTSSNATSNTAGVTTTSSVDDGLLKSGTTEDAWDRTRQSTTDSSATIAYTPHISAIWLLKLCHPVANELDLDPAFLARSIVEASKLKDPVAQQSTLFDSLGASDAALDLLSHITPHLPEIQAKISLTSIAKAAAESRTSQPSSIVDDTNNVRIDLEEERRQLLLQEAFNAAEVAAVAQAEVDAMLAASRGILEDGVSGGPSTHIVQRSSERQAIKLAEKAADRAAKAFKRAKEAGAILDESELMAVDRTSLGSGGLMNRSREALAALQAALLPEGARKFYDDRGLPRGTIRETDEDGTERVIIPPAPRPDTNLHPRLKISEILDPEAAKAFTGTTSLNPMQSTVFPVAYHSRDNMLICAPTGAGKTNVAMLATTAHFRDVGLLGSSTTVKRVETGTKVVYIAPMKALAQEVVEKFSSKLQPLGLVVRELTGDVQLSRAEAASSNVLVTTPEKWDVVTRKSGTDETSLGGQCGLLIIDEVHLLADERGAVIESVVARVQRYVEVRQRQVRIVALSATLPNYDDVAEFLQVPDRGLFFFGPEHRPVPLQQQFVGVNVNSRDRSLKDKKFDEVCFETVVDSLRRGYQVMVFVHSRKGTGDTARSLADMAAEKGILERHFVTQGREGPLGEAYKRYADKVKKSRNREVQNHFQNGIGVHHAGMLRGDRKLVERMFSDGAIRVLCCTATLAWGVNLPAHSIVIKGTEVYNPEKSANVDLSILDVQQIFGRAGRPQFDDSGEATLITTADAFPRYIDKLVRAVPIESNFTKQLADHLNAEIVGGSVADVREAARWLTYTYLYVRMLRNPLAYGISADKKSDDPMLHAHCKDLVMSAAKGLDKDEMIRYDQASGNVAATETGRIAAHYYIQAETIAALKHIQKLTVFSDSFLFRMVASASEFNQMKLRQEELEELEQIIADGNITPLELRGAGMDRAGHSLITGARDKVFVLMQALISRANVKSFTLISDVNYISSNAGRVARALFEIYLNKHQAGPALKLLRIAKSIDNRIWWFQTPLRQFDRELSAHVLHAIENRATGSTDYDTFTSTLALLDMHPKEVGQLCRAAKEGSKIQGLIRLLPKLAVCCKLLPITADVIEFRVGITPEFQWHGRWHSGALGFWFWVETTENSEILHHEHILLPKRMSSETLLLDFYVPTFNKEVAQFLIRVVSDSWVGVEEQLPVSYENMRLTRREEIVTNLQDLTPLPVSALHEPRYEHLYRFKSFNPIQTQLFHVLYHSDCPILLGAPTGSGKTIVAEIAILRMKRLHPRGICVYIAPMKALARERLKQWRDMFGRAPLSWKVLELSGDTHHDKGVIERADLLVCTPEKWDLISRGWRSGFEMIDEDTSNLSGKLKLLQRVKLLVLDEVHLLGEDRGAVLEAIVSRTRFISRFVETGGEGLADESSGKSTRIIGLSTALANANDLADWIGIEKSPNGAARGLYNFRNSVRPVPVKVHAQGYSERHYCPRMATMNKPCLAAIKEHSPVKPVLIFVASRRQTRLTAFDLISYVAADDNPKRFLKCSDDKIEAVIDSIQDEALRHSLAFGIGLHHAGLASGDRESVERLFLRGDIQVLVATATLAWGVNLPAHLVIVKGSEYFDGKTSRYVDYPLTDVLQMIGRAGRPGFDTSAVAVVMCTTEKKPFYSKFLHASFPAESCLQARLCENLNAEISCGTVSSLVDAVGYLKWTFFARRVRANPSYYGAISSSDRDVENFLTSVAKEALINLRESGCVMYDEDQNPTLRPLALGVACSSFYLSHRTPKQMEFGVSSARKIVLQALEDNSMSRNLPKMSLTPFARSLRVDEVAAAWLLYVVCSTHEFDEQPVRHNEEFLNEELSDELMWGADTSSLLTPGATSRNPEVFQDPHTKCFLLVQAYLERARLPISDYVNDTKSVIENVPRLLAAMQFIATHQERGELGSFELMTQFARTRQLLECRTCVDRNPLMQLPNFTTEMVQRLTPLISKLKDGQDCLFNLRARAREAAESLLSRISYKNSHPVALTLNALYALPMLRINECRLQSDVDNSDRQGTAKLKVEVEVERDQAAGSSDGSKQPLTLTVLLGTSSQSQLLAVKSLGVGSGTSKLKVEIDFDWNTAVEHGGESEKYTVLRFLWNEVRGLDSELFLSLQSLA